MAPSTPSSLTLFLFLLALRLLNALSLSTFFQPDEFFQSLEPAYQIAFGDNQGAWITWVSCTTFLPPRIESRC
jgi:phosphatidylinositol glycan class B